MSKLSREKIGTIVSKSGNKSISVQITRQVRHKLLGKFIRRSSKIHAHDEDNIGNVGDTVKICECRPISKLKSWKLAEIVEKAKAQ